VPLGAAIVSYGLTMAFQSTTTSLFLANAVHVGPLLIGLYFALRGAASIGVSLATGRLSDRLRDRRVIIAAAGVAGVVGGVCQALLRDYALVLVTGVVCLSIGYLTFSQLFAYATEYAAAHGRPVTSFTSVVRSGLSAAWVAGPPLGLFLMARYGFGPLYLITAALSVVTVVLSRWGLSRVPPQAPVALPAPVPVPGEALPGEALPDEAGAGRGRRALPARMWLLLGAVVALGTVNQMYGIDVSLFVTADRHLSAQLVGWMAGLAAGLEIPVIIVAGRVADRLGKRRVVLASAVVAAVFFGLLPLAASPAALLALQGLNAAWVGVALSVPMVMVQEEAGRGAGAASALYSSAFMAASVLAGAVTGIAASAVGYGNVFWVCAALSLVACGLLAIGPGVRPGRARGER
jgi:SET family sugar efflux transporter-like MFS transporter